MYKETRVCLFQWVASAIPYHPYCQADPASQAPAHWHDWPPLTSQVSLAVSPVLYGPASPVTRCPEVLNTIGSSGGTATQERNGRLMPDWSKSRYRPGRGTQLTDHRSCSGLHNRTHVCHSCLTITGLALIVYIKGHHWKLIYHPQITSLITLVVCSHAERRTDKVGIR